MKQGTIVFVAVVIATAVSARVNDIKNFRNFFWRLTALLKGVLT